MTTHLILQIQFATDIAMVILIWLVQLVIYPAFRVVDQDKFNDWHLQYMMTISRIVVPLMLIQALCHGFLTGIRPSAIQWVSSGALLGAWITTFKLSVPCHQMLQKSGYQAETINLLINSNWIRTFLWSLVLLLTAA